MMEMVNKTGGIFDGIAYYHMQRMIKKRPLDINIETINFCPLKCAFCCNRVFQRQPIVMDNELFESIVRQYFDIGGGGLGISSMQSDFFSDPLLLERMKIIRKYKKRLWVYSTTPLISCKKYDDKELTYILRLMDCLQISVEGHDEESYKAMAGVDGFKTMKEQLKRVKRIIDEHSLKVKIDLYFRTYSKRELLKSELYSELSSMFHVNEVRNTFFSWFGTIKKGELPKGARILYTNNEKNRDNCVVPNTSLAIMADGKAVGCGCIDWLEKYVIGDCRKNTLTEIWRCPKAVAFRNAFVTGRLPSICMECGLYASICCMRDKKFINYKPTDGLYYLKQEKKLIDIIGRKMNGK